MPSQLIDQTPSHDAPASPWQEGDQLPVIFEARLAPKRSLPRHGFHAVLFIAGGFWLLAGLMFYRLGAWPVAGFGGLDVLLVYLAFRTSYAHARLYEEVRLTRDELGITRMWPGGRRQTWRLEPYWSRVELTPVGPDGSGSRLAVSARGRRIVLGSFLSPLERANFAEQLSAALAAHKGGRG